MTLYPSYVPGEFLAVVPNWVSQQLRFACDDGAFRFFNGSFVEYVKRYPKAK